MMPSFYPNAPKQQRPPTPPEFYDRFYDHSFGFRHDSRQLPVIYPSRYNTQTTNYDVEVSKIRELRHQHLQYNTAPTSHFSIPQESRRRELPGHAVSTQMPANAYGTIKAPLLPPIRVSENGGDDHQQHVQSKCATTINQPKEEKAAGGVAAHLDYEMEDMVDFVSEITQGIYDICGSHICLADIDIPRSVVDSRTLVRPEFRKFVSQVLSSTRLPSSTILLGLHYLAMRMTSLSIIGELQYDNGSVRVMLTTALLLGSKFLDDNTFQNRSWSEVSNIPVRDINNLEAEWLTAIGWNMHVDPGDPDGFLPWHQQWQRYQVNKANRLEPLVQSLQRTHLDETSVQQQPSLHQLPSPMNNFALSNLESRYDPWSLLRNSVNYSPPSAPETGPNTPEWYDPQNRFGFGSAPNQTHPSFKLPAPLQIAGINPVQSNYHTFNQQYNSPAHNSNCPCGYCLSHHERSFRVSEHLMLPVAG